MTDPALPVTARPAFTHVALHVRDLEASIRFYRRYCGLRIVHERTSGPEERVVWMAQPGREQEMVFVLLSGGHGREQRPDDYSHLGFACATRADVDQIAAHARRDGCLAWEPRAEPYPVGYYCGLKDPNGFFIEFSHGQPLGPGAPALAADHTATGTKS